MFQLTGRIMEERLKHGWTLEQFAKQYDVSTEEFLQILKKTFSSKAYKGMLARFNKNGKLFSQKHSRPAIVLNPDNQNSLKELESKKIDSPSPQLTVDEILESLYEQKEVLKEELNNLELQHKHLTSERNSIRNSIANYNKQLISLKEMLIKAKEEVSILAESLEEKLSSMQSLNLSISKKQKEYQEIDEKISSLRKISIFVYTSGDIDIESDLTIDIPECDSELVDKIFNDELANSLTVKEIKSLSRCIVLAKILNSKNLNHEIAFENTVVEECFTKFNKE